MVGPLGRDDLITVQIGQAHVSVLVDPGLGIRIGDTVKVQFDTEKVQFFAPKTEKSLLWA